jgi:excisionase family DNA binding protein
MTMTQETREQNQSQDLPELVDIDWVAGRLNVKRSTIRRLLTKNELPFPALKLTSRIVRFDKKDVERYIGKNLGK